MAQTLKAYQTWRFVLPKMVSVARVCDPWTVLSLRNWCREPAMEWLVVDHAGTRKKRRVVEAVFGLGKIAMSLRWKFRTVLASRILQAVQHPMADLLVHGQRQS